MEDIEKMSQISDIQILVQSSKRTDLWKKCRYEPSDFSPKRLKFGLKIEVELKKIFEVLAPDAKLPAVSRNSKKKQSKTKNPAKKNFKAKKNKSNKSSKKNSANTTKRFNLESFHKKEKPTTTNITPTTRSDKTITSPKSCANPMNLLKKRRAKKKQGPGNYISNTNPVSRYGSPSKEKFKIMHLQAEKMSILSESHISTSIIQAGGGPSFNPEDSILQGIKRGGFLEKDQVFKKKENSLRKISLAEDIIGAKEMGDMNLASVNVSQIVSNIGDETATNFSIIDRLHLKDNDFKLSNSVFLIGGASKSDSSLNILRYDIDDNKWYDLGTSYEMIKGGSILLHNGNIALIGGKDKNGNLQNISEYSLLDNRTTYVTNKCEFLKRTGFSVIQGENYFFVLGGNDGQSILKEAFCVSKMNYEAVNIPNMLIAREDLAAEIDKEGKLYAIGGFGGYVKTCLSSIEFFNPTSNTWEMLTEMSCGRRAPGTVLIGQDLYVVGGHDGFKYLNTCEKFNLVDKQWTKIAKLSEGKCMFSTVKDIDNDHFYVLGGFKNESLDTVERYDIDSDKWIKLASIPEKRYLHSSVLIKI